ncbi:MAG TPA: hypothetical protein VK480_05935 [Solirubrobacterales bacterium]|nr:hypothetical protein [Solirubrobacterales bacterium]
MEKAGSGKLANRSLDRVDFAELPRSAGGHFPDQLVLGERGRVVFQDLAKNGRLFAIVFA